MVGISLQTANLDYIKVSGQEHHDEEYAELDLDKDGNISLEALIRSILVLLQQD